MKKAEVEITTSISATIEIPIMSELFIEQFNRNFYDMDEEEIFAYVAENCKSDFIEGVGAKGEAFIVHEYSKWTEDTHVSEVMKDKEAEG